MVILILSISMFFKTVSVCCLQIPILILILSLASWLCTMSMSFCVFTEVIITLQYKARRYTLSLLKDMFFSYYKGLFSAIINKCKRINQCHSNIVVLQAIKYSLIINWLLCFHLKNQNKAIQIQLSNYLTKNCNKFERNIIIYIINFTKFN